eukprot:gene11497-13411_t
MSSPTSSSLKSLVEESNHYYYYSRLENTVQQPLDTFGLVVSNHQNEAGQLNGLSLVDLRVDLDISDSASQCAFTKSYKNEYSMPVEAKYVMPLPPSSAVSNFQVTYDDRVLNGKVKERQDAFNKYSDAIASGGQAFLAENNNGYFTISLGNIPPGKEVTISITTISETVSHLDQLHFYLHRFMFPSYQFNLLFNAKVHIAGGIKSIEMNNHNPIITMVDTNLAIVQLETDAVISNNLVMSITPLLNDKPTHMIEHHTEADSYAIGINFFPQLNTIPHEEVDQKSEFIFVLDCSGSMAGGSIKKAKLALEILMRSLNENTKFNIFLFGSTYKSLFSSSRIYSDETLDLASAYISNIDANLGGTNLLPPIRRILSDTYDQQYPRQVFILTDGEITDRDGLIDFVAKEVNTTRVFTMGIGSGVDRELVVGLSKACKGYHEFIDDKANMKVQIMKLLNIAMEPTISNIQVNWGTLNATLAPRIIRPIFNNEHIEFDNVQTKSDVLHTLAALNVIKDLEEIERKGTKNSEKDKIISLGKKYNLASSQTSGIISHSTDNTSILPSLISLLTNFSCTLSIITILFPNVPTLYTNITNLQPNITSLLSNITVIFTNITIIFTNITSLLSNLAIIFTNITSLLSNLAIILTNIALKMKSTHLKANGDSLMDLIRVQKANGRWVGSSISMTIKTAPITIDVDVWTTLVIISHITSMFSDKAAKWDLVVKKATKFVKIQLNKASIGDQFDDLLSQSS